MDWVSKYLKLTSHGNYIRSTVMSEAWKDSGIDQTDPGQVKQWYNEDMGVVVLDLQGNFEEALRNE